MKLSEVFNPTLKEDPKEADVASHKLMLRAGLIRKNAAGIYTFLPFGMKVLSKVERIVREEMNRIGAREILMPVLQPDDIWKKSNRWYEYGPEMMRLKDRNDREFCLGPTHEEIITDMVMNEARSYRDLPIVLYQIQVKFRDELRPRFGVMRAREFIMKDAYSFHSNNESLDKTYQDMHKAYSRIIERCGLAYRVVKASSGLIGGDISQEFMVIAKTGEDALIYCNDEECGYAANIEIASSQFKGKEKEPEDGTYKEVATPGKITVDEVGEFLSVEPNKILKTLIFNSEEGLIAAIVRGDRDINENKLRKTTGIESLVMLPKEAFGEHNLVYGFVGPVGLDNIKIIADHNIMKDQNYIAGSNKIDFHLTGVNHKRDFKVDLWEDISNTVEGDSCPSCGKEFKFEKGIEVGHIFKLGTKYSQAMKAFYLDEEGNLKPYIMGCYGIGVSRMIAAAIEQNHDEKGIIWPVSLAPFKVSVISIGQSGHEIQKKAEEIYDSLNDAKIDTIYDNRDERPGVKFAENELIGFPLTIVIGRKYEENGKIELKIRKTNQVFEVSPPDIIEEVKKKLSELE